MREILFRAKREDNKEWTYGVPYDVGELTFILLKDMSEDEELLVYKETVGQYIGREDMMDNKIFEDDLLSTKERDMVFQIVWDSEDCVFKFKSIYLETLFEIDSSLKRLEVIGNIHEKGEIE